VSLHRDCVVVDTMGPAGPSVYSDDMLARLDELASQDVAPALAIDALELLVDEALLGSDETFAKDFWERYDASGVDVSSFTIGAFGTEPFSYANAVRDLGRWTRKFDSIDRYLKVTKASDAKRAHDEGRHGVILNFQNTTHFGADLGKLQQFYDLGVRIIQLTYNARNLIGDGCTERNPSGLSLFGLEVVKKMNQLGILIDVSHCSPPTAIDAALASSRPIAITHGFAEALSPHDRAASDELIRTIGERGGYVGIVLVPFFLTPDADCTLDHFLRHVEHVSGLIGADKVGVGTDWAPPVPPRLQEMLTREVERLGFRPEHRVDWSATVKDLDAWEDWPNITAALLAHGYSEDETRGFLGANFLRVFEAAAG
jgi:membrane dipeptidase